MYIYNKKITLMNLNLSYEQIHHILSLEKHQPLLNIEVYSCFV